MAENIFPGLVAIFPFQISDLIKLVEVIEIVVTVDEGKDNFLEGDIKTTL